MTHVVGIDPGPTETGWIVWDAEHNRALELGVDKTGYVLDWLRMRRFNGCQIVIEDFDARGMPAGHDLIKTLKIIGRMEEIVPDAHMITRGAVKLALCGQTRAKDVNVNAAVRARLCAIHGFSEEKMLKGTSKAPGPCYAVKSHVWPALALVLAWLGECDA